MSGVNVTRTGVEESAVKKTVAFRIFRFSGKEGDRPSYADYALEVDSNTYVMDALDRIKEQLDPSLTYRSSCHHGVCGSCTTRVNGVEVQTCKARVFDLSRDENVVVVEPMRNFAVLRDLVVDMEPFFAKIKAVRPRLSTNAEGESEKEVPQSRENLQSTSAYEACIECGACYSACPIVSSDPNYLGPAALVAAYRSCLDRRDKDRELRLTLVDDEEGCWRCHSVFSCVDVCPEDVKPALAIAGLRRMVISTRLKGIFQGRRGLDQ